MLPKEHGAWNLLILSLFVGWILLGSWNFSALALSLIWIAGFILRAPLLTARHYWNVDRVYALKNLKFAFLLFLILITSGGFVFQQAPHLDLNLLKLIAGPLACLIFIAVSYKQTWRSLLIEMLGFLEISLLASMIYLTNPLHSLTQAMVLWSLLGGYFCLALIYVKVRQSWLARSRKGEVISYTQKFLDLRGSILAGVLYITGLAYLAWPHWQLTFGPLMALLRIGLAGWKGNPRLPMMKLGIQEMGLSIIFAMIVLYSWHGF
jgi:hypothetical protein